MVWFVRDLDNRKIYYTIDFLANLVARKYKGIYENLHR